MIRIVIADDSASTRELLNQLLSADDQINVVGMANDGREALELTCKLHPDVLLMDIQMPGVDGIQAAKMIMKEVPTAIVMISAVVDVRESKLALEAFDAGVLAVLSKPPGPASPEFSAAASHIIGTIKAIAAIKPKKKAGRPASTSTQVQGRQPCRLIAIACSVGGPAALQTIFSHLEPNLAVPVVVVQHIAHGFISSLVAWLQNSSRLPISVATPGEKLLPGHIYIAPDKHHLRILQHCVVLDSQPAIKGFQPSATALFSSIANEYGKSCTAVILTGMGDDGVEGLKLVRENGGLIVAQDQASSVVFGMNGEAVARGLVDIILPLTDIASFLSTLPKHGERSS